MAAEGGCVARVAVNLREVEHEWSPEYGGAEPAVLEEEGLLPGFGGGRWLGDEEL